MRRKMKLICLILAYVEKAVYTGNIPLPEVADYSKGTIEYHVKWCREAGYCGIPA